MIPVSLGPLGQGNVFQMLHFQVKATKYLGNASRESPGHESDTELCNPDWPGKQEGDEFPFFPLALLSCPSEAPVLSLAVCPCCLSLALSSGLRFCDRVVCVQPRITKVACMASTENGPSVSRLPSPVHGATV